MDRMKIYSWSCLLFASCCLGCTGDSSAADDAGRERMDARASDSAAGDGRAADSAADGSTEDASDPGDGQWTGLIMSEWELAGGTESYYCERLTVAEDTFVTGLKSLNPLGTHHVVLTLAQPTQPDGGYPCDVLTNTNRGLYAAGVGSNEFKFPEGVALHIAAGQQLLLNLHLYNVQEKSITGTSGVLVQTIAAEDVVHEAEMVFAGPISLSIPPGDVVQQGQCTTGHDTTVVGLFPHMHQLGTHIRVTLNSSVVGAVTIHDQDYDFLEQTIYPIDSIQMRSGDTVAVECTYRNDTGATVTWGDSSKQEMCLGVLLRYPRGMGTLSCFL